MVKSLNKKLHESISMLCCATAALPRKFKYRRTIIDSFESLIAKFKMKMSHSPSVDTRHSKAFICNNKVEKYYTTEHIQEWRKINLRKKKAMSKWNFCFCSWRKHNLIYKRQLSNTIWFIKENYRISIKALSLHSWGSLPLLPTAVLPLISCLADQLEQVLHTGMPKKTFSLVPLHPRLPPSKDPSIPPHFLHRTSWRPAQYQICLTWELIYWMEGFNEQQGNQKKTFDTLHWFIDCTTMQRVAIMNKPIG